MVAKHNNILTVKTASTIVQKNLWLIVRNARGWKQDKNNNALPAIIFIKYEWLFYQCERINFFLGKNKQQFIFSLMVPVNTQGH